MNILLLGYYGYGNLGDELMLNVFLKEFVQQENISKVYVHVNNADDYSVEQESKVVFFSSRGLKGKTSLLVNLIHSSFVVWGGGTCIYNDKQKNEGLTWFHKLVRMAILLRKKVVYLGVGIECIAAGSNTFNKAKYLVQAANYIYIREKESFNNILSCYQYKGRSGVGGDPVFNYNFEGIARLVKEAGIKNISFAGHFNFNEGNYSVQYADMISALVNAFDCSIHFLPAHNGEHSDNTFHRLIYQKLSAKVREKCQLHNPLNADEYIGILSQMSFHIGMRLHSVILADILGVPNIGIVYAPKVKDYIVKTGCSEGRYFYPEEGISPTAVKEAFDNYVQPREFLKEEKEKVNTCLKEAFL